MEIIGAIVTVAFLIVFFGLLYSLPVMWLWNLCLVGAIAGVQPIGWLQAWGIMVLCGFLFKSTMSSN
jgi:hypothetical protein